MMALVLGAFIVSYLPYAVLAPIRHRSSDTNGALTVARDASVALLMCNSAINGVIYGAMNSDFRTAFKQLLRPCCWRNAQNAVMSRWPSQIDSFVTGSQITHTGGAVPVMHCYKPSSSVYSVKATRNQSETNNNSDTFGSSSLEQPTLPTVQ